MPHHLRCLLRAGLIARPGLSEQHRLSWRKLPRLPSPLQQLSPLPMHEHYAQLRAWQQPFAAASSPRPVVASPSRRPPLRTAAPAARRGGEDHAASKPAGATLWRPARALRMSKAATPRASGLDLLPHMEAMVDAPPGQTLDTANRYLIKASQEVSQFVSSKFVMSSSSRTRGFIAYHQLFVTTVSVSVVQCELSLVGPPAAAQLRGAHPSGDSQLYSFTRPLGTRHRQQAAA